ncbi:MAG: DUF3093 domain-containing protein [Beutenbergiaceae bacterium]
MGSYRETLNPSIGYWFSVPGIALMAGLSTLPLGPVISGTAAVAAAAITAGLLLRYRPRLSVTEAGFHAGPAFLEAAFIGEVEELDPDHTRAALGPQLRGDAYVVHRSWIKAAVRVHVADEQDPVPYWLVSTSQPTDLARALVACRDRELDQAAHSEQTG